MSLRALLLLPFLIVAWAFGGALPAAGNDTDPRADIAFLRGGDLWVINANGTGLRRVTRGRKVDLFSAHRGQIVYQDQKGGVFLLKAPNRSRRRVAAGFWGTPTLSPDGKCLFVGHAPSNHSDAGDGGSWRVEVRAGRARRVLPELSRSAKGLPRGR